MSKILSVLCAVILLVAFIPQSRAGESPWAVVDQLRARLISGAGSESVLDIELADGWHSYWKAPGDAGLPPKFDWTGSINVTGVDVAWPFPKRFDEMGIVTFGYEGSVMFPLKIHSTDAAAKTHLNGTFDIMVCKDICIPQKINLSVDLDGAKGAQVPEIELAKRSTPKTDGPLTIDTVVTGPDALVITASAKRDFTAPDVFALTHDAVFTGKPEITVDPKDKRKAMIKIPKPANIEDMAMFMDGKDLDVVLVDGDDAAEKTIKF